MDFPRSVYAIQHNKTKKIYIGSSKNVKTRYMSHIWELRNGKHKVEDMQADFDEYGEDYSLYILDEIKGMDDRCKEYEWMAKYKTNERERGYNYKDQAKIMLASVKIPIKEGIPPLPKGSDEI